MNYVELNIAVSGAGQAEILMAMLADYPFESFVSEDDALKAYIPEVKLAGCKATVDAMLNSCGIKRRTYLSIDDRNWNAEWEKHFDPVDVDGRLVIRAPFHAAAPAGKAEVVVMPRMSFGTGHHATTYLMASALLGLDVQGRRVLDVGSGTGVLAIIAVTRGGAASADAVDTDEWADASCRDNAAANGVADRIRPLLGDVSRVAGNVYDCILANINRNVLTADMPRYAALLAPGGDLLLSGFLERDAAIVGSAAEACGLRIADTRTKEGWALVHCVKA